MKYFNCTSIIVPQKKECVSYSSDPHMFWQSSCKALVGAWLHTTFQLPSQIRVCFMPSTRESSLALLTVHWKYTSLHCLNHFPYQSWFWLAREMFNLFFKTLPIRQFPFTAFLQKTVLFHDHQRKFTMT